MTDLVENFNISLNHPGEDDLAIMRANWFWLHMAIGGVGLRDGLAGLFAPEWTTVVTTADTGSPLDYSQPTEILMSKTYTDSPQTVRQFKYVLTWVGGFLTGVVYWNYDATASPQWQIVTGGTITITRDAVGNFTGATPA